MFGRTPILRQPAYSNRIAAAYHRRTRAPSRRGNRNGETQMADVARGFDYVVVGGGTAGCALAARLSEDSRRTICLLEAGGSGKSVFVSVPGTAACDTQWSSP